MRIRNPPKFIMSISFIMSLIMTLLVFQCGNKRLPFYTQGEGRGRIPLVTKPLIMIAVRQRGRETPVSPMVKTHGSVRFQSLSPRRLPAYEL